VQPNGCTFYLLYDKLKKTVKGRKLCPLICSLFYDFGKRKKRHGGVIKISDEEYERLKAFIK
ncbi:MAG: hypothetical protein IJT65_02520, partial [Eubacterium sp.]|nr:hypothetical protein [Eubacterium sp.]